jgi:hypothetical protein
MKHRVKWTKRCEDGVKREVRVEITRGGLKWQFKRADEDRWDYDSQPTEEEWNTLEEILSRRAHRGKGLTMLEAVRKQRNKIISAE